ncbi:MAG: LLM class flavin-dependent oxidoreductase [Alphaproteobacteria bacterium]|nr:LLM class flavin-dependent oxidoreductase [Alphaproteobacteria bacterium]
MGSTPTPFRHPAAARGIEEDATVKISLSASDALPLAEVAALAPRAEALGYHGLWRAEGVGWDAFTVAALWAERTRRIGLATGIVSALTRHPGALARAAMTVAELSGGRFRLGLGVGNNKEVPQPRSPLGEMERATAEVRRHCAERLVPEATVAAPPIWLAALRPRMVKLARRVADGVLLTWVTPEAVREVRSIVGPGFPIACTVRADLGSRAAVAAAMQAHYPTYAWRPVYQHHLRQQGIDPARPGDDDLLRFVVRGRDDLDQWREAGVDELVLRPLPVGGAWWRTVAELSPGTAPATA